MNRYTKCFHVDFMLSVTAAQQPVALMFWLYLNVLIDATALL
jgi:hypothetical protein